MALFSKDSRSSSTYICRYGRFCSLYSFAATQFVIGSFDRRITFRIPFSEILVNPAISMIHGTLSTYSKRGICVSSSLFSSPTHRYISPQRYLANAPPFKIVNTSSYFSPGRTPSDMSVEHKTDPHDFSTYPSL